MSAICVRCEVREYPDDVKEYRTLIIRNHWNERQKVVLEIDGNSYTFFVDHLVQAIKNAQNAHT